MVNEAHTPQRERPIRDVIARMRHGVRVAEGRCCSRHRGRQQPPGVADRSAAGVKNRPRRARAPG